MKYLLISHIFPPAIDGGSRVIYKIGKYLESTGNQTLYVSSNCRSSDDFVNSRSKEIVLPENPNHIYLPVIKNLKKILKIISFLPIIRLYRKGPIFKFAPTIKAIKKILVYKPEVIICGPFPTLICHYCYLLKRYFLPYSKLIINASFHQEDKDFYNKYLIKVLKNADLIWALTNIEKNFYIQKFRIDSKKIITIGNGINEDILIKTKPKYDSNNILFIGSHAKHKNIEILIKAFISVKKDNPNISLTIAGQKTLYSSNLYQYKNINSLNFIESAKDEDIIKLIDSAQFVVQPSTQESFGLTLVESAARKKMVLVSNTNTLVEVNSQLSNSPYFSNQIELEKLLIRYINNPKECQSLGEEAYQGLLKKYTWKIVGKKLESAILNL